MTRLYNGFSPFFLARTPRSNFSIDPLYGWLDQNHLFVWLPLENKTFVLSFTSLSHLEGWGCVHSCAIFSNCRSKFKSWFLIWICYNCHQHLGCIKANNSWLFEEYYRRTQPLRLILKINDVSTSDKNFCGWFYIFWNENQIRFFLFLLRLYASANFWYMIWTCVK